MLQFRFATYLLETIRNHLQSLYVAFHLRHVLVVRVLVREQLLPCIERRDRGTKLVRGLFAKPYPQAVLFAALGGVHDDDSDRDEDEDECKLSIRNEAQTGDETAVAPIDILRLLFAQFQFDRSVLQFTCIFLVDVTEVGHFALIVQDTDRDRRVAFDDRPAELDIRVLVRGSQLSFGLCPDSHTLLLLGLQRLCEVVRKQHGDSHDQHGYHQYYCSKTPFRHESSN